MNGKNVVLAGHDVGINLETRRGRQTDTHVEALAPAQDRYGGSKENVGWFLRRD